MGKEKVLVLFSGGYDSTLMTLKLLEYGYEPHLIYINHLGEIPNIVDGNSIIQRKLRQGTQTYTLHHLSTDKALLMQKLWPNLIFYNGNLNNYSSYRAIRSQTANLPMGNITQNQIQCCECRTSMYIEAIIYALNNGFKKIYDGARKDQLFAIEQPEILDIFKKELFAKYNLTLLTPMLDYDKNNWAEQGDILRCVATSNIKIEDYDKELLGTYKSGATYSEKCYLGSKMERPCSKECLDSIKSLLQKHILPISLDYINAYSNKPQQIHFGYSTLVDVLPIINAEAEQENNI